MSEDGGRLVWFVLSDIGADQIGDIDLHVEAAINATAFCREEPNDDDYLAAIRTAIDRARGVVK